MHFLRFIIALLKKALPPVNKVHKASVMFFSPSLLKGKGCSSWPKPRTKLLQDWTMSHISHVSSNSFIISKIQSPPSISQQAVTHLKPIKQPTSNLRKGTIHVRV